MTDEPTPEDQPAVTGDSADEAAAPTEPTPTAVADPAPVSDPRPAPAPEAGTTPAVAATATAEASATAESPARPRRTGQMLVIGVIVLVLGAGAGFLIGRSTADSGPDSLAAAATATAKGDLPVGKLDLQELLQAIGKQGNGNRAGGLLGGLLGGNGNGNSNSLNGLLGRLLDRLEQGSGGSDGGSSTSAQAFLGVAADAAPSGQTGVLVRSVASGGPAADGGIPGRRRDHRGRRGHRVVAVGARCLDPRPPAGRPGPRHHLA